MGGKNKHFTGETTFQAEPEAVRGAIRAFSGNWLAGWNLTETPDGIEATGQISGHLARATFRIEPAPGGAKLTVALQVEHADSPDPARADAVEDYDELVHKWLEAIPWWIAQKQTAAALPAGGQEEAFPAEPRKRRRLRIGNIVGAVFLISWFLAITIFALLAFVGLVTGELMLPAKGSGDLIPIRGWTARIVSTLILAFYGSIVHSIWKYRKKHKGQPWI